MLFLVTGAAGFIGSQVSERLLALGHHVRGVDCFTDYYPQGLKEDNLAACRDCKDFELRGVDLANTEVAALLEGVDHVIHLAAQAGVRASWGENFKEYTHNNIMATQGLLEAARHSGLKRMVYASSSSVYGDVRELPMREESACFPVSPYGVSKLAAEHLCGLYNKNFGVSTVSLRYFTVYGPRQRPDMAFHRIIRILLEGGSFRLFGDGEQSRDFTFVGDIVDATISAALIPEAGGRVFNIGGGARVSLNHVIGILEEICGKPAKIIHQEVAKGDVRNTEADTSLACEILGYKPSCGLGEGLAAQVQWMKDALPLLQKMI